MSRVISTVRRAQRRRAIARGVRVLGVCLTVGASIGLMLVVLGRLLSLDIASWMLLGAPIAAALVSAIAWAALTPRHLLRAAADVDRALDLDDRLGSAISLQQRADDDPFAALAVAEGERIAPDVRVKDATPIAFGGAWWAWPSVLAVAVAAAIFLPALDLAQRAEEEARQTERIAEREQAVADLAEARQALTPQNTETSDLATPTDLQTLEELERQLTAGDVDPDAARAKAAGALNDAANALEREAAQEARTLDSLQDELNGLDSGEFEGGSPLSKALSAGDFAEAQRLIEEYQQQLHQLSEDERQDLAEQLDQLADSLEQPTSPEDSLEAPPEGAEQSLRDLGVPEETIDQLRDETDPESIRDALREEGLDEPVAETLADRLAEENQQRAAEEQAKRDAEELKEALQDAAEQTREPQPAPNQPSQESPSQTGEEQSQPREGEQPKPGDTQSPTGETPQQNQEQGREQGEESQPSSEPGTEESPTGEPQNTPQEQPGESGEGPKQSPQGTPQQTPDPNAPAEESQSPTPDPNAPPTGTPEQTDQPGTTPDTQPSPTDPSQSPIGEAPTPQQSPDGAPQPSPDPNAPEGQSPSQQEGAGDGDLTPGLERARRKLEELNNRKQGAQENRESAEAARQRAKEMLDRMSPEQREQFERWAKELDREKKTTPAPPPSRDPSEFARDPLDLRPEEPAPDRVIAQWFNPDAQPGESGDVSRRVVDDQLRDAARGAERAVEEQAVHRRYSDIIKKYFDAARKKAPAPNAEGDQ